MEDPQSSLNLAFEHYENGQIKVSLWQDDNIYAIPLISSQ